VAAQGASNLSLSIKVSGTKVLYGHDVTLSGRISSGAAGRRIEVFSKQFGRASMHRIATVTTGVNGGWSLRVQPAILTSYEARIASVATPSLSVGVEPSLLSHVRANGSILAHVGGGRAFTGRSLELQRAVRTGWSTIEKGVLSARSDTVFAAPVTAGGATLRIALSVNEAGGGFLGSTSHAFAYRPHAAFVVLAPRNSSVEFGRSVELSGRISSPVAGQRVKISTQGYGSSHASIRSLTTTAGGRFSFRATPRIETIFRASWAGLTSPALSVGVHPALTVGLHSNHRLSVSVAPARAFLGRNVELEQAVGAAWHTVAERPLVGPGGGTIFSLPTLGAGTRYRVAMSVNAAGLGYLSAFSRSLALSVSVQAVSIAPSTFKVLYGHDLTLSGSVSSGRSGAHVSILARPYGTAVATVGATVVTGASGRWSFQAGPTIQTIYVARYGTSESRPIVVGVEPRMTTERLSNGRIATRVITRVPLSGRLVELQQLAPGHHWKTIARARLDDRASAVFGAPIRSGRVTLRVAMSVNEAGAGLLGATSHAFVYRAS
jgi:hypothetical protein